MPDRLLTAATDAAVALDLPDLTPADARTVAAAVLAATVDGEAFDRLLAQARREGAVEGRAQLASELLALAESMRRLGSNSRTELRREAWKDAADYVDLRASRLAARADEIEAGHG